MALVHYQADPPQELITLVNLRATLYCQMYSLTHPNIWDQVFQSLLVRVGLRLGLSKHLGMQTVSTNICERRSCSQELSEFQRGAVIGCHLCNKSSSEIFTEAVMSPKFESQRYSFNMCEQETRGVWKLQHVMSHFPCFETKWRESTGVKTILSRQSVWCENGNARQVCLISTSQWQSNIKYLKP